jgi:hypothetical protein
MFHIDYGILASAFCRGFFNPHHAKTSNTPRVSVAVVGNLQAVAAIKEVRQRAGPEVGVVPVRWHPAETSATPG